MANGYGSYVPGAPDPTLLARMAANQAAQAANATAENGLSDMEARAAERYRTGNYGAGGNDRALPTATIKDAMATLNAVGNAKGDAHVDAVQKSPDAASAVFARPIPGSSGPFGSPAENLGVARRGAFDAGPTWNGVGGGGRSAMQMAIDMRAKEGINNEYKQGVAQNELEAGVRGDPMTQALEARKKTLAYEDSLPANETSSLKFGRGSSDAGLMDYADQRAPELGTPTAGEYRANRSLIAQAQAKTNPKDISTAGLETGRGRIAEELSLLRQQLDAKIKAAGSGPIGAAVSRDAEAQWQRAVSTAQTLAEIMKTGYPTQMDLNSGGAPPPTSGK